jgi:hypothetical protein
MRAYQGNARAWRPGRVVDMLTSAVRAAAPLTAAAARRVVAPARVGRRHRHGATAHRAASDVHVVPNERAATWQVFDPCEGRPVSEHTSETEAEAAARRCARSRGDQRIVIHDRYHRTYEARVGAAVRRSRDAAGRLLGERGGGGRR